MIMTMRLQEDGGADDEAVIDCENDATGDDEQGGMWMTSARLR